MLVCAFCYGNFTLLIKSDVSNFCWKDLSDFGYIRYKPSFNRTRGGCITEEPTRGRKLSKTKRFD